MHLLLRISLAIAVMALAGCGEADKPSSPQTQSSAQPPSSEQPDAPAVPKETAPEKPAAVDPDALASRGRAVYTANCIACHNTDPKLDGGIGPAVAGASFALIEARVMRNEYPEGYKPKRGTRAMIALPYLEKDLAALVAFLAK